ncbi:DUF4335 domain-containing protein [Waterburya agarophytonicola K14]|uniref:DUF4335 domain-containing protein n=1 Tax=Waterburya agarophytonicola KI4 TaxID=2874699 RepID=A0A964BTK8_9CYAN|nr:DUF4335 domain-containing protein [Waterburya agarophytonicola]MCC0178611.1 DUF4335 domain-containing protein [Waterburya agarophytonicola KI4]
MTSTIYRFTPPTCTLEIKGKNSILSRWAKQDILKDFKFKLSFDDPRLPSLKDVTITGDRWNLELLKTAVDGYMLNFLCSSFTSKISSQSQKKFSKKIPYLQTKGLTECELYFGNLNSDSTEDKITLSTVQLFDLVTALEAYNTQIAALPELKQTQRKKIIPLWGGIAAVALVAVSITAILLKSSPMQNIASSPKQESSENFDRFDDIVAPQAPSSPKKGSSKPRINESLSSTTRLPPPPAVDTPKPKPNIPDPADYPLPKVTRQSGLSQEKPAIEQPTESTTTITTEIIPEKKTQPDNSLADSSAELNRVKNSNDLVPNQAPSKPNSLQEIKAYFQSRWQPPEDLKQSLEYRLYLNSDGSIKRVIPIGKASALYLSKTNIPVRGEAFISPLEQPKKLRIRLLLNPDGGVKTFIE